MKILITGFEPFGTLPQNSSWEAVRKLPDVINGRQILKLELPVVFSSAAETALGYARRTEADAIILTGQAEGYRSVAVERVAINLKDARIPDNGGFQPEDEHITEGGENAYFSTADVKSIAGSIRRKNIPCVISYSAGTYVCNDLYYNVLHGFDGKAVFIHLPELDNAAGITPENMVTALEEAVKTI